MSKANKKSTKSEKKLNKNPDGTVDFTLTIDKKTVKEKYQKTLKEIADKAELKGFRKGKAPTDLVEKEFGKQQLYTKTLQRILPREYIKAVNKLEINPISNPKVEPIEIEENKDWKLKVTVAEKPEINLGDYKKKVSEEITSSKIWVPGKQEGIEATPSSKKPKENQQSSDEKIGKALQALLDSAKLKIPDFLIEEQVSRQLSQLIQHLEKMSLDIDQYLASLGKSSQQLRKEYQEEAERTLKLELILNEVADDLDISVSDDEVNKIIQSLGDEKLKTSMNSAAQKESIRASLRKRKVIDYLLKL